MQFQDILSQLFRKNQNDKIKQSIEIEDFKKMIEKINKENQDLLIENQKLKIQIRINDVKDKQNSAAFETNQHNSAHSNQESVEKSRSVSKKSENESEVANDLNNQDKLTNLFEELKNKLQNDLLESSCPKRKKMLETLK